ncbi:MAG: hemerythrin domain-containing protein [Treponema sp.]|nr:hemerythrin domain-containing protein [Treponema sp.]
MFEASDELIERLEEGVKTINDQHKKIFDFTTDLFAHCVGDEAEENMYFQETIDEAVNLVVTHFKTEEALMLETKFPFYEFLEHKKEHDGFIVTVTDYVNQFHASGNINLLMFASYAKWWVIGHIKRHDSKYVTYFNQITADKGIEQMKV